MSEHIQDFYLAEMNYGKWGSRFVGLFSTQEKAQRACQRDLRLTLPNRKETLKWNVNLGKLKGVISTDTISHYQIAIAEIDKLQEVHVDYLR